MSWCHDEVAVTKIIDDLEAEQDRLASILAALDSAAWASSSLAVGWTVCDVVLHLAQTEEAAAATVVAPVGERSRASEARGVDAAAGRMVGAERAAPQVVFDRWRLACDAFVAALRAADPDRLVQWVGGSLKPATLATTRLAEHWAHGLDITGALGAPFPDTDRLHHIAWLGHRTLPYAFALAREEPQDLYCELRGPDGAVWRFGPATAESSIRGDAGSFCRVGAQRLSPQDSGLETTGPHGRTALRLLRNYAA
jgi:uncharacterized protein (TIGR03084 family)